MQGLTVCPWSRVAKLSISYVSRTIMKPKKVARFVAAKVSYCFCRYMWIPQAELLNYITSSDTVGG